ncbi:MAG: phosphopyruvate hydratase [Elusimicrobia bacterium CG08_land_8_20_14_0_20_44_26]|nr:MAG: phosphopyruvate hydratase [Elusimicrobia bacterium CG08_land_8_20_14_0_20_44_26]
MVKITSVKGRQIFDSRGNPTVEVDVCLSDGAFGRADTPSGASTGIHEALELRDKEDKYNGKGVLKAVANVAKIEKKIKGMDGYNQRKIDEAMIALDGTPKKTSLGANAILAVSMAVCRSAASSKRIPLYKYIRSIFQGKASGWIIPVPYMNIMNGGAHADNNVDIQEFMIAPIGGRNFVKRMRMATEIYHKLKSILKGVHLSTSVGDEGGFAPNLKENEDALRFITRAIEESGYKPGKDVAIALDPASSGFYKNGRYILSGEKPKKELGCASLIALYSRWINKYHIISIEDGFAEDDWNGWVESTKVLGGEIEIIGDDLFVTNKDRLKKGISVGAANAILIKLNQIGSVTETLDVINYAYKNNYRAMVSHRSGETEDSFIADFAVGTNCGQIKSGAPARGERLAKYNQLLRIEEEIKS